MFLAPQAEVRGPPRTASWAPGWAARGREGDRPYRMHRAVSARPVVQTLPPQRVLGPGQAVGITTFFGPRDGEQRPRSLRRPGPRSPCCKHEDPGVDVPCRSHVAAGTDRQLHGPGGLGGARAPRAGR